LLRASISQVSLGPPLSFSDKRPSRREGSSILREHKSKDSPFFAPPNYHRRQLRERRPSCSPAFPVVRYFLSNCLRDESHFHFFFFMFFFSMAKPPSMRLARDVPLAYASLNTKLSFPFPHAPWSSSSLLGAKGRPPLKLPSLASLFFLLTVASPDRFRFFRSGQISRS